MSRVRSQVVEQRQQPIPVDVPGAQLRLVRFRQGRQLAPENTLTYRDDFRCPHRHGGNAMAWGDLSTVRLTKPTTNWLVRLVTREKPPFQLMVSKKGDSMTTTVYSTRDAALAKRIELAIGVVAQRRGALREG